MTGLPLVFFVFTICLAKSSIVLLVETACTALADKLHVPRFAGSSSPARQKTDRKDAELLLKLMLEDRFPRTWIPSAENRDLRQLLWHWHRLVQMRTRIMNQLQALAMNEGKHWKKKLWSEPGRAEFEKLSLAFRASRRRQELLESEAADFGVLL
jgi:transposase